jgi:hypothetical protein
MRRKIKTMVIDVNKITHSNHMRCLISDPKIESIFGNKK